MYEAASRRRQRAPENTLEHEAYTVRLMECVCAGRADSYNMYIHNMPRDTRMPVGSVHVNEIPRGRGSRATCGSNGVVCM